MAALPSVAQTLPLAYDTAPMRESFPSRTFSCTRVFTGKILTACQHGTPVAGTVLLLPMHSASGVSPALCVGGAGTPYSPTPSVDEESCRLGVAEFSDLVFASRTTSSEDDVPSAVKTARELTKYSVPLPLVANWSVPGEIAGIALKI